MTGVLLLWKIGASAISLPVVSTITLFDSVFGYIHTDAGLPSRDSVFSLFVAIFSLVADIYNRPEPYTCSGSSHTFK